MRRIHLIDIHIDTGMLTFHMPNHISFVYLNVIALHAQQRIQVICVPFRINSFHFFLAMWALLRCGHFFFAFATALEGKFSRMFMQEVYSPFTRFFGQFLITKYATGCYVNISRSPANAGFSNFICS